MTKGANEMKEELYEKKYFEDFSGYVLYETTTKKIEEIAIDRQIINVIGLDEFVKLKAENLKMKRKTKKLRREVEYLIKQVNVLHQALFDLKFRNEIYVCERGKTPDGFMNIISKALEKYYENEYYKRCEEEDATND